MIFSIGETRHYQVEPAFALRVAEAAWDSISAFFSNIERVLVSSVLHVVCEMYDNLSCSVRSHWTLSAAFLCCASSRRESGSSQNLYISRQLLMCPKRLWV